MVPGDLTQWARAYTSPIGRPTEFSVNAKSEWIGDPCDYFACLLRELYSLKKKIRGLSFCIHKSICSSLMLQHMLSHSHLCIVYLTQTIY